MKESKEEEGSFVKALNERNQEMENVIMELKKISKEILEIRIVLACDESTIGIVKDYEGLKGNKGLTAQLIAELEIIKLDLLDIYEGE